MKMKMYWLRRLGKPFWINGTMIGVLMGVRDTSAGVIAIILRNGKHFLYNLSNGGAL